MTTAVSVHVEPILAYRAWGVKHMLVGGLPTGLCSTGGEAPRWPPQQIIPASCWYPHKAPAETCVPDGTMGCGYYAMKAPPKQQLNAIQGEVYLWGKVIEHEDGYRAEYAYPAAIYSDSPYATELAALYGVPVKEPPYEPDRKSLENNSGGANYSAGTATANTSALIATYNATIAQYAATILATGTLTVGTGAAVSAAPAVAPRARKGARLTSVGYALAALACAATAILGVLAGERWDDYAIAGGFGLLAGIYARKALRAPGGKS